MDARLGVILHIPRVDLSFLCPIADFMDCRSCLYYDFPSFRVLCCFSFCLVHHSRRSATASFLCLLHITFTIIHSWQSLGFPCTVIVTDSLVLLLVQFLLLQLLVIAYSIRSFAYIIMASRRSVDARWQSRFHVTCS